MCTTPIDGSVGRVTRHSSFVTASAVRRTTGNQHWIPFDKGPHRRFERDSLLDLAISRLPNDRRRYQFVASLSKDFSLSVSLRAASVVVLQCGDLLVGERDRRATVVFFANVVELNSRLVAAEAGAGEIRRGVTPAGDLGAAR